MDCMEMLRKSIAWDYFSKTEDNTLLCKICGKEIPNKGNTSNMFSHIRIYHPLMHTDIQAKKRQKIEEKEENFESEDVERNTQISEPEIIITDGNDTIRSISVSSGISEPGSSKNSESSFSSPIISGEHKSIRNLIKKNISQTKLHEFKTINSKTQDSITRALSYCIAVDMLPYSMVEKPGFRHLMKVAVPSFKMPDRKTMTEKKIPDLYIETRNYIQEILTNFAPSVSLTTDCWTSTTNEPYISLTCHFIDSNWELQSFCLNCTKMAEDHNAENLSTVLKDLTEDWNIEENNIVAFTTDSGANIVKAIKLFKANNLSCFGHAMNTAVSKALENEELKSIITKIARIQNSIAHSWKMSRELKLIQNRLGTAKQKIPTYTKTRWWSLLKLIKVVVEQKLPLYTLLLDYNSGKYTNLIVTPDENEILKCVIQVLQPIEIISDHMSGEKHVTASVILPIYGQIKTQLTDIADETQIEEDQGTIIKKKIITHIMKILDNRYTENYNVMLLLIKATFFDPRFKTNSLVIEMKDTLENGLIEEMMLVSNDSEEIAPIQEKKPATGLAAILKTKKKLDKLNLSPREKAEEEFTNYNKVSEIDVEDDPLEWWRIHSSSYPKLAFLAKKYLSLQATSVASERVFSRGGNIVTDHRASLTAEHAEQLIFLSQNKSIVIK